MRKKPSPARRKASPIEAPVVPVPKISRLMLSAMALAFASGSASGDQQAGNAQGRSAHERVEQVQPRARRQHDQQSEQDRAVGANLRQQRLPGGRGEIRQDLLPVEGKDRDQVEEEQHQIEEDE